MTPDTHQLETQKLINHTAVRKEVDNPVRADFGSLCSKQQAVLALHTQGLGVAVPITNVDVAEVTTELHVLHVTQQLMRRNILEPATHTSKTTAWVFTKQALEVLQA